MWNRSARPRKKRILRASVSELTTDQADSAGKYNRGAVRVQAPKARRRQPGGVSEGPPHMAHRRINR